MAILNGWKLLTIVAKTSILHVAVVVDPASILKSVLRSKSLKKGFWVFFLNKALMKFDKLSYCWKLYWKSFAIFIRLFFSTVFQYFVEHFVSTCLKIIFYESNMFVKPYVKDSILFRKDAGRQIIRKGSLILHFMVSF